MQNNEKLIETLIENAQIGPWKSIWGTLKENGEPNLDFSEENIKKYIEQIFILFSELIDLILKRTKELPKFDIKEEEIKKIHVFKDSLINLKDELCDGYLKDIKSAITNIGYFINLANKEKIGLLPFLFSSKVESIPLSQLKLEIEEHGSLINYYEFLFRDEKNINILIALWKADPIFSERIKILEEALKCHQESLYHASTTLFLIQINALFDEATIKEEDRYKRLSDRKKTVEKIIIEKAKRENLHHDFLKDSVLLHVIKDVLRGQDKVNQETFYPNRHEILHGKDLKYGTLSNSTKCIVLLDLLRKVNWTDYH